MRALKLYINRTEKCRTSSLFVATVAHFGAVSSTTLSKWLVECIKMAGPEAIFADKVRAHEVFPGLYSMEPALQTNLYMR